MNVLTIGNFDGVHQGHRALLDTARTLAGASKVAVVCFEPLPAAILRPDSAPARLTSADQRRSLLLQAGADEVRELEPTPELMGWDASSFVDWLCSEIEFEAVVEGEDFRFARGRTAGVEELAALGVDRGFQVHLVEEALVTLEDRTEVAVRSSLVRWLLEQGRVVDASKALGRPYRLAGTVVSGDKRGRTLGFPTANLAPSGQLLPADGVYAGVAHLPDGSHRPAGVSIGSKPTFGTHERVAEAHLIDHDAPLDEYGWKLEIDLLRWIRGQLRFEGVDELVTCMKRDCEQAKRSIEEQCVS